MRTATLLATLAATTLWLAAPPLASARTPIPDLPSGVDQAYFADSLGSPENGTVTLSGALNLVGAITITCDTDVSIDYFDDGTTAVTAFAASSCMVFEPLLTDRCTITTTATNLSWGDRFGYSTSESVFRDYINVSIDVTFANGPSGPCPVTGTFPETGTLSPMISISGDVLNMTFGAGSGTVSGPLGSANWQGTLTGTLPTSDTQLIHD